MIHCLPSLVEPTLVRIIGVVFEVVASAFFTLGSEVGAVIAVFTDNQKQPPTNDQTQRRVNEEPSYLEIRLKPAKFPDE